MPAPMLAFAAIGTYHRAMLDTLYRFFIDGSGWIATWPTRLLALIWLAWVMSWVGASLWQGRTQKQVATWNSLAWRIPILFGGIFLAPWTAYGLNLKPLYDVGVAGTYWLAVLTLAGIAFTWWGRIYLGQFWSNAVTRKEDHRVVDTGPYGLVRHPIYTGLIFGIFATALAVGTLTALLGALCIAFGQWQKASTEERFLSAELGPEHYGPYCRRVPMLVPFLPPR